MIFYPSPMVAIAARCSPIAQARAAAAGLGDDHELAWELLERCAKLETLLCDAETQLDDCLALAQAEEAAR